MTRLASYVSRKRRHVCSMAAALIAIPFVTLTMAAPELHAGGTPGKGAKVQKNPLVGTWWKNKRPLGLGQHSQYLKFKDDGTFELKNYYKLSDLLHADRGKYTFAKGRLTLKFGGGQKVEFVASVLGNDKVSLVAQSNNYGDKRLKGGVWPFRFEKIAGNPPGKKIVGKQKHRLIGCWATGAGLSEEEVISFRADGTYVHVSRALTDTGRYTYANGNCILTSDDNIVAAVEQWPIQVVDSNTFVSKFNEGRTVFRRRLP